MSEPATRPLPNPPPHSASERALTPVFDGLRTRVNALTPGEGGVGAGFVEVRDFGLSYDVLDGEVEAVRDVSIHVRPGEFVSIIGPSGCGKSTLLNAVAGFLKPTVGTVTVDGEPVNGPSADRGMVFQQYSLFPWKTVRGNVEFGLKMKGRDRHSREVAARTLLSLAGLAQFENQYPDRLSGGMKQRVGIVRALATGPKVLLLDEPFGSLDAQTRVIMQQILTNMWQRLKISVLFVTHDIDEAIFLSDRVYCMTARPGTIKAEIMVPLDRPRQPSMMMSSEFLALRRGLMSLIREESLKAMGGEISDGALQGLSIDLHGQSLADVL
jgi:NitT/TauT family transport system ATP-binding protein